MRMITNTTPHDYEQLFALPEQHSLKQSSNRRTVRNSTVCETRWLDEYDVNDKLIARFRTWTHQAQKPPYRKQVGWERYSLSGTILDREIRYSRRSDNEYVH